MCGNERLDIQIVSVSVNGAAPFMEYARSIVLIVEAPILNLSVANVGFRSLKP